MYILVLFQESCGDKEVPICWKQSFCSTFKFGVSLQQIKAKQLYGRYFYRYGATGKLFNYVKAVYTGSRAYVQVNGHCDQYSTNVGVRQGCIMSPWLFNIFMDTQM